MKKIFIITIIMFLVSSILQILLNYIINEQILSRILFGVDYSTIFIVSAYIFVYKMLYQANSIKTK